MALSSVEKAIRAARTAHKAVAGVAVTLEDENGTTTTGVKATLGTTTSDDFNDSGVVITTRFRDFLIDVADYEFDGVDTEPRVGHFITIESSSERYQVLPDDASPESRKSDRGGQVWRIHTKRV